LIAFTSVKGIVFLGSFCVIFWLKKCRLIPGLSFSNGLISCNKGLHCNFACPLYSKLIIRLPKARVIDIISNAGDIEIEFAVKTLLVKLIRMNSTKMCNYIKFFMDPDS
jgi:ribonucleotide reductase beta subunit family protein with ferritin-like domain